MRLNEITKDEFKKRLVDPKRTMLLKQIKEFKEEVEDDYDFTVTYTEEELAGDHYFDMTGIGLLDGGPDGTYHRRRLVADRNHHRNRGLFTCRLAHAAFTMEVLVSARTLLSTESAQHGPDAAPQDR